MLGDAGVDQLFAKGIEARNGPFLVHAHEPAVTDHIGSEDGSKPSFDAFLCHGNISLRDTRNGLLYG